MWDRNREMTRTDIPPRRWAPDQRTAAMSPCRWYFALRDQSPGEVRTILCSTTRKECKKIDNEFYWHLIMKEQYVRSRVFSMSPLFWDRLHQSTRREERVFLQCGRDERSIATSKSNKFLKWLEWLPDKAYCARPGSGPVREAGQSRIAWDQGIQLPFCLLQYQYTPSDMPQPDFLRI